MTEQMTILVIEDDKFISRAYTDGLTRAGFKIISATDGVEALAMLKDLRPDLILLDLLMPIKDGFDVLAEIKSNSDLKDIPTVVLSNLSHEKYVSKATKMGADGYLVKCNYSIKELVKKIKTYL